MNISPINSALNQKSVPSANKESVMSENPIELSVVVPITERYDDIYQLHYDYKKGIDAVGMRYELIYVVDGEFPDALKCLRKLISDGQKIKVVTLAKHFGETAALNIGFKHSQGDIILTLPAYQQILPDEFPKIIQLLNSSDMALAVRWPRRDSFWNRCQANVFNFLIRKLIGLQLHDSGCGVKAFKRAITEEIVIYGDQHRFLPVLAYRKGFKVKEVQVLQADRDIFQRFYSPGIYFRRLLDLLTIFFLIKFTKKPLRFFGLLGLSVSGTGVIFTTYVVMERLFLGVPLSTRPALFLSSLLIVLGFQLLAMGLIGEIIIFTHAKEIKEYTVEKVIN